MIRERVSTILERAFYSMESNFLLLKRSATGRADMSNPDEVLKNIKKVRTDLAALELAAKSEKRARAELARERAREEKARAQRATVGTVTIIGQKLAA